jgi:hypothetical protein
MADKNNPGQFGNRSDTEEQASKGGKEAHARGTAHEFDSEEARRAGEQSHKNDE